MTNRVYIAFFLSVLGIIFAVRAEDVSDADLIRRLSDELITQITARHTVDARKLRILMRTQTKATAQQEDLLATMLALPPHKRQYHYPRLNDSLYFSKKVRTHPLIAAFKGKKPTDLPPTLSTWAKTYLDDLPAEYYPALDPDLWRVPQADSSKTQTAFATNTLLPRPQGYAFPDVKTFYTLSDETIKNYKKTDLTQKNVQALTPMFHALNGLIAAQKRPIEFQNALNVLTYLQQKKVDLTVNPFQTRINQLILLGFQEQLDKMAQANGFLNARDFALKADRILKAYRVHFLTPSRAAELKRLTAQTPAAPWQESTIALPDIHAYAALYAAPPGDVYFAGDYLEALKNMFSSPVFTALQLFTPLDS